MANQETWKSKSNFYGINFSIIDRQNLSNYLKSASSKAVSKGCSSTKSETIITTDVGCFGFGYSFNTFSQEKNDSRPVETPQSIEAIKNIAKDYYKLNKNKVLSKEISVIVGGVECVGKNKYKVYVTIPDPDYSISKGISINTDSYRFNGIYNLEFKDNSWVFELVNNECELMWEKD